MCLMGKYRRKAGGVIRAERREAVSEGQGNVFDGKV